MSAKTGVDGRVVRFVAQRLSELIIQGNRAHFEIGRVIDKVWTENLWTDWMGVRYATFNDWCWAVCGRKQRWARYLRSNYLEIQSMDLAPDTMARVMRHGWSKLYQVLRMTRTEADLLRWIDRIENERMTEADIRAEVAIALGTDDDPTDESAGSASSPSPSSSSGSGSSGGSSAPRRRRISYELTFTNDDDLRVFVRAVKLVRQRVNPEMSQGEAAALIATNYLGVAAREDEGGIAVELDTLIQCIEQGYRVRLAVTPDQPEPRQPRVTTPQLEDEPF